MSPNLRIALRFLTSKRRAMAMSLACIVLGVGLFIVTQATTTGFEALFVRTILGTNGAIRIEDRLQNTIRTVSAGRWGDLFEVSKKDGQRYIEGIEQPDLVMQALREFPNVSGASEVLTGTVIVRAPFKSMDGKAFGIRIEDHLRVSDLGRQIEAGSLAAFRADRMSVIIGVEMARRLLVEVGDSFELLVDGQARRYKIAALFETGISDIDRQRLYLHLSESRSLFRKPSGASFLQVALHDTDRAPSDAAHMTEALGHSARCWQDRESTWLGVFRALRISSGITVSVFTLIAGLAMFNTLVMIVMEKTREIAILRSMGYTRSDISLIFFWQAAIVLVLGILGGLLLGAGGTWAISQVPLPINGIFKTETFIVNWSHWHYVSASLAAILMVMAASIIPARRAAQLEPGDVIRGTGQ